MVPRPDVGSKWVEPAGRAWLTAELFRAGFDVAIPELDRGIDLIAYRHKETIRVYLPIQMKAASSSSFGLETKYERIPGLVLVYVWGLVDYARTKCYAMNYRQALRIMNVTGYTSTESWRVGARSWATVRPAGATDLTRFQFRTTSS